VELPVTEQDPPFLSHVDDREVFGVLRHVLVRPADRPGSAALDGLEVRVYRRQETGRYDLRERHAARPIAQDHRASRGVRGGVADLRRRVVVRRQVAGHESATVTDAPLVACLRKPGAVAERSDPVPPRARASVPELMSVAACV
jgi:hypothetical protein